MILEIYFSVILLPVLDGAAMDRLGKLNSLALYRVTVLKILCDANKLPRHQSVPGVRESPYRTLGNDGGLNPW